MQTEAWTIKPNDYPTNASFEEKAKFLLRHALLAPSGHNSQPWIFKIGKNTIKILPDYKRGRSAVDSEHRELFVSLGASVKLLEVASERFGWKYKLTINDKGATLEYEAEDPMVGKSELYDSITKRRTYREEFDKKKIPEDVVWELEKIDGKNVATQLLTKPEEIEKMASIVNHADKVWYKSKLLIKELEEWMRDDLEMTKDGLPSGMINMYKIAAEAKYLFSKDSKVAKAQAELDEKIAKNTPLFVLLISKGNTTADWIEVGRVYGTIILTAQKLGLASGVLGAITELTGVKKDLANTFKIDGQIQLVLSVGYPKMEVPLTPRRPLEELLA
jgi:nitroreductase